MNRQEWARRLVEAGMPQRSLTAEDLNEAGWHPEVGAGQGVTEEQLEFLERRLNEGWRPLA